MSKYLYFQDMHFTGKNSCNRLGNYFDDLLIKFDEIIQIAKDNNCDSLIDGGDLLETEKPSYNVLDEIADRIDKAQLPIYSLFGNHTMSYGHIENSKNTGLAHLQKRSEYFKYIDELDIEGVDLKIIDYSFGIEDKIKQDGIMFDDSYLWKICIVHALLTPSKFFDSASYVQLKDIETNADLLLIAHYHKPYTKVIGNTAFLNIGCCGRNNIDEAPIDPSVAILDTEKRSYEVIKLKSAKPANKIFDLSKHNELKDNKKDIKEFLDSLKNVNFQSMDIGQQIVKIGKEKNINDNIIDYILNKMEKVKNE